MTMDRTVDGRRVRYEQAPDGTEPQQYDWVVLTTDDGTGAVGRINSITRSQGVMVLHLNGLRGTWADGGFLIAPHGWQVANVERPVPDPAVLPQPGQAGYATVRGTPRVRVMGSHTKSVPVVTEHGQGITLGEVRTGAVVDFEPDLGPEEFGRAYENLRVHSLAQAQELRDLKAGLREPIRDSGIEDQPKPWLAAVRPLLDDPPKISLEPGIAAAAARVTDFAKGPGRMMELKEPEFRLELHDREQLAEALRDLLHAHFESVIDWQVMADNLLAAMNHVWVTDRQLGMAISRVYSRDGGMGAAAVGRAVIQSLAKS